MPDRTTFSSSKARRAQPTSKAQLLAERDFLLARADHAGHVRFGDVERWTGISSNALVRYIFGGEYPTRDEFPRDPSDLAACYRTVYRLPDHLNFTDELGALLYEYREAVRSRYDLYDMDRMLNQESVHNKEAASAK